MTEKELVEEIARATARLSRAESEYVSCQNLCNALDNELFHRHEADTRGVPKNDLESTVARWSAKMNDIQRAADTYGDDPKSRHSLLMQAELLKSCISDLEKILSGSQTATNRT
jgi:hypothetical protein